MIIYETTKKDFVEDVFNDSIVNKIHEQYNLKVGGVNPLELRSWKGSMESMYKVLNTNTIPDDSGVAIEFKIPLTSNRIDFIISGYDSSGESSVVIIELKGWEAATKVLEKDGIVNTFMNKRFVDTTHPSYQIYSYYNLIQDFNESVQIGEVILYPCAYLYNFKKEHEKEITDNAYSDYINKAPLYLEGDAAKLRGFIEKYIKKGDLKKNLYEINSGKIRPSKSLQDVLLKMLKGKEEFFMIDSQKVVYEDAIFYGKKSDIDCKKRVMIVEGGPGTGKSVLAVNLLVKYINEGMVTQYVSKNSAPRNVYSTKLKKGYNNRQINHLFRGSGSYVNSQQNDFSVLLVDEAHRLNEKSGLYGNLGENQVKEIINAAKLCVFFIDENQRIHITDIGSKNEIEKYAKKAGAEVFYYKLDSQFRCNGSDGYLAWLNDVLDISKTANYDGFDFDYDFRIFDNPVELRDSIETKNEENNKSRLVAGYCWNWLKAGKNDSNTYDINIGDFHISWNLGSTSTWAIDKESVKEAGCVHTCQGLEFDYVGVIIGPDLRYENEQVITDYSNRARTDYSLRGIKSIASKDSKKAQEISDEIVKNTYRTLMTRGQKGCYIYCCDKGLQEYLKKRLAMFNK